MSVSGLGGLQIIEKKAKLEESELGVSAGGGRGKDVGKQDSLSV